MKKENDILKKFEGKNHEEILEEIKKWELKEGDDFLSCILLVNRLRDFKKVVDKNLNQLEYSFNKLFIGTNLEKDITSVFNYYIILEIYSFYEILKIKHNKNKLKNIKIPDYLDKLKEIRNKIIAHRDKKGKVKSMEHYLKLHKDIDDIGMGKIVRNFNSCADILLKEINNL